jgi:predicted amidohydrolase
MNIALVHLKTVFENFKYNFQQIQSSYVQAVQSAADIVIFSETSFTGYNILSKKNLLFQFLHQSRDIIVNFNNEKSMFELK